MCVLLNDVCGAKSVRVLYPFELCSPPKSFIKVVLSFIKVVLSIRSRNSSTSAMPFLMCIQIFHWTRVSAFIFSKMAPYLLGNVFPYVLVFRKEPIFSNGT